MNNRKFVASYSGGKDSILALTRTIEAGMEPAALLITYNTDAGRSWFHGITKDLLQVVERSLNIPIICIETSGEAYAQQFQAALEAQKRQGVEVCVFGDIDLEDHLQWCRGVCQKSGIEPCFPLWQEPRRELVQEFIKRGFTAKITVVNTGLLSDKHLGMVLSEDVLCSIEAEGADACGENGEYHTIVLDGPLFAFPLPVEFGHQLNMGKLAVLPVLCKEC